MLALAIEFTGVPVELAASADSAVGGPWMGRAAAGGSPVSVAIAEGRHPVPFRTRKLSLPAPMVLPWRRGGRVGRRRDFNEQSRLRAALFVVGQRSREVEASQ